MKNNRAVSNDDERLATSQTGFRGRCHEVLVFGRPYLDVIEPPSKPVTTDTNAVAPTRRPRATRRRNTSDRKTQTRLTSFFLGGLEKKIVWQKRKKRSIAPRPRRREAVWAKQSVRNLRFFPKIKQKKVRLPFYQKLISKLQVIKKAS